MYQEKEDYQSWICDKCQKKLELTKVKVHYLEGEFEVELLNCPTCHQVFINESLALGKMAEVEQGLEDK